MKGYIGLALRCVLLLTIAYGLFVAVVYIFQRRLLYMPDTRRPTAADSQRVGLRFWPTDDDAYRGFVSTASPNPSQGTVIVFHGNAGMALNRSYYVRALEPLGYRVILAEYPGYGGRTGHPSEAQFVIDAKETIQMAHERFGEPLFLWGESMGCGVAAAAAADSSVPVAAMILLTPWDTLPSLAQSLYWYLPVRWLARERYDNVTHLQSFTGRVAMLITEHDEIIPYRHSRRLYETLSAPKKQWIFQDAGHNSWPVGPYETWWQQVMRFAAGLDQTSASSQPTVVTSSR